jgi:PhzF family phenazine biosynthesis protein
MKIPYYQVDAFTSKVFCGNPAGVCLLETWLDDRTLQNIAAENNLSETAFIVEKEKDWELRWFTPKTEVDLCGHATLASGYIVFSVLKRGGSMIRFSTRSGILTVQEKADLLVMDFPSRKGVPVSAPAALGKGIGCDFAEVYKSRDYLVILEDEEEVKNLRPDFAELATVDCTGIIVSARGREVDFVSRFFAPRVGIPEDPVTGSAHCTLIPYWSSRLGKNELVANQVSPRGGELFCSDMGDRVSIAGRVVTYLEGYIYLDKNVSRK